MKSVQAEPLSQKVHGPGGHTFEGLMRRICQNSTPEFFAQLQATSRRRGLTLREYVRSRIVALSNEYARRRQAKAVEPPPYVELILVTNPSAPWLQARELQPVSRQEESIDDQDQG